jgi:hypothetical protein
MLHMHFIIASEIQQKTLLRQVIQKDKNRDTHNLT